MSCAADRQVLGKITSSGVFLEELETNPARFMPDIREDRLGGDVVEIDLNRPWMTSAPPSALIRCGRGCLFRGP